MLLPFDCPVQTPNSIAPASDHIVATPSVQSDTPLSQVRSRLLDLFHQLFVCFRDIVEREHAVSEFRQKVSAEGDESPEGNLEEVVSAVPVHVRVLRLTTGTTSSWILAGKGTKPRNALRYSCWSKISMGVTASVNELEAYCDKEGEDCNGLLCARHDGQGIRDWSCSFS
jgi:hypothetical protein